MVASEDLSDKVRRLFRDKLYVEVPSEDTDILKEGLLDSLGLVELLLHIEQEFNVDVPLEELEIETFRSIRAISRLLESRIVNKPTNSTARPSKIEEDDSSDPSHGN